MNVDLMVDEEIEGEHLPAKTALQKAAHCTLRAMGMVGNGALCIRLASDSTVRELNRRWRSTDRVTDVLAFPQQEPPIDPDAHLGDLVLAWPFVAEEAERLGVDVTAHAMHLVVHGVLHLMGLDHQEAEEAKRMQALERRIMNDLGLHDPYA